MDSIQHDFDYYVIDNIVWSENEDELIENNSSVNVNIDVGEISSVSAQSHHVESSDLDKEDNAKVDKMYGDVGPCCAIKCNKKIPKEFALKHRYSVMEMSKAEQDLVILSQLRAFRQVPELAKYYSEFTNPTKPKYPRSKKLADDKLFNYNILFHFSGMRICREMFFFLYNVGIKRYKNLVKHLDAEGIQQRVHKLTNVRPVHKKALSMEETKKIVHFIKSFADENGLPLPSRVSNCNKFNIIKLPSNESKSSLHRKYLEAIKDQPEMPNIARSTFAELWAKYCPHILVAKSGDDSRETCRNNNRRIRESANLSEEIARALNKAREHLKLVEENTTICGEI